LDGLKSRPIKEICREYGISETQYYRWRDQAIKGMKNGFRDKRQKQIIDLQKNIRSILKVSQRRQIIAHRLVKEKQISLKITLKAMS